MRVLVAPDKFKGCLTAAEVAAAIAEGLTAAAAAAHAPLDVDVLPLADGGDGSVAAAVSAGFSPVPVTVSGPTGRPCASAMAFDGTTCVVEVAATSGMAMMGGALDAVGTSSRGVGDALRAALAADAGRVVVGLGGSASTDGGSGLLAAMGARFLTVDGTEVSPTGGSLESVTRVDTERLVSLDGVEVVGASDVRSPLLGPFGAARVFGPQKGAAPEQVERLEKNLAHLVGLLERAGFPDAREVAQRPGAGSAGGIGFAIALLGGRLVSGAEFFLDLLGFDAHVRRSDVVITGEGSLDSQTQEGKLIAVVAERSAPRRVIAVAGRSTLTGAAAARIGIHDVHALADLTTASTATDPELSRALLRDIGRRVGRELGSTPT